MMAREKFWEQCRWSCYMGLHDHATQRDNSLWWDGEEPVGLGPAAQGEGKDFAGGLERSTWSRDSNNFQS